MHNIIIPQIIAGLTIVFTLVAFGWRLKVFNSLARPIDRAPARGSIKQGLLYAYTLGMAPWAKESTRRHWLSYLRGVFFHIGIFLGLGILVISPWINLFPTWLRIVLSAGAGLGAVLGLAGFLARLIDPNLKALSTPDDYFAVLVVSVFLATACLGLSFLATLPIFYIISAFMLIYAPFSKIRHCIYFAYSRLFFGKFTGTRGILPHQQQVLR
jgi:nitrate reductase gamma subunit